MSMKRSNSQIGFSITEIVLAVSMVVIFAMLSFQVLNLFITREALDKDAQQIASQIKEARSATLASRDDSAYGVHFTATRTVMFKGVTFTESDPNNSDFILNSRVQISMINLNGAGIDILFDRLTGATSQYGSITLSLVASTTVTKTVNIGESGIVEF